MFNEEARLRDCLTSLGFCDQILCIDVGSADRCAQIAANCGAEVLHRRRQSLAETTRVEVLPLARHDWIMRFDPDEVFDPEVLEEVQRSLADPGLAVLRLPYRYYFKGVALHTTIWGGIRHLNVFFHRQRARVSPHVHGGISTLPGYGVRDLDIEGKWPVRHFWMDGYRQLFEKHGRYIREEGPARLARNETFTWRYLVLETVRALRAGLITTSGWRGGWRGIFLSFFYAWYVMASCLSLRTTEMKLIREGRTLVV